MGLGRLPSTPMAGQRCMWRRRDSDRAWVDSSAAATNTCRSRGTPQSSATPAVVISSAAAWSTDHWVLCHLLYGNARGRLSAPGSRSHEAALARPNAASGLDAATSLKRPQSPAMSSRCRSSVQLCAARRALSITAYCCTADTIRTRFSGGASVSPECRQVSSGSGVSGGSSGGASSIPARRAASSRARVSPPHTSAASHRPDRTASMAELSSVCCDTNGSASTVAAPGAPTAAATARPGSRSRVSPPVAYTRPIRRPSPDPPASATARRPASAISFSVSSPPPGSLAGWLSAATPASTGTRRSFPAPIAPMLGRRPRP